MRPAWAGIHCSSCIWLLEHLPRLNAGIVSSRVDFPNRTVSVRFKQADVSLAETVRLLRKIGYEPVLSLASERRDEPDAGVARRRRWLKLGLAGFAFGNVMLFSLPEYFAPELLDDTLNRSRLPKGSAASGAGAWLSKQMMPLWRGGRWWHMTAVGMLNGILPCGFVYVGLAGSLTVANPLGSAAYMALFGLGTIPAMWVTGVMGRKVAGPWRDRLRRATPWLALILGVLMILRGMELGIPFISPVLGGGESCH